MRPPPRCTPDVDPGTITYYGKAELASPLAAGARHWPVAFAIVVALYTVPDLLAGRSITGNGQPTTFFGGSANVKKTSPTTTVTTTTPTTTATKTTPATTTTTTTATTKTSHHYADEPACDQHDAVAGHRHDDDLTRSLTATTAVWRKRRLAAHELVAAGSPRRSGT